VETRRIQSAALRGLAHPLRVQLYDLLAAEGPSTATALGRRVGESSGVTSYHLRQLERHGFVEEDPSRGNRRERWWRAVSGSTALRGEDFTGDPAMSEAFRLVDHEWQRARDRRRHEWLATRESWPLEWRRAADQSVSQLGLTVAEAAELSAELLQVVLRWSERVADRTEENAPEGTRRVEVQVSVFPHGEPPDPRP
jgi:DNA-binding transcriptional ArsR family regulator